MLCANYQRARLAAARAGCGDCVEQGYAFAAHFCNDKVSDSRCMCSLQSRFGFPVSYGVFSFPLNERRRNMKVPGTLSSKG